MVTQSMFRSLCGRPGSIFECVGTDVPQMPQ